MKTAESVTEGHPDKVCDQISDALLDEYLRRDPSSRVAVETFGSHGMLVIGGEVTSSADFDVEGLAKQVYRDIGYDEDLKVFVNIEVQSPDISQGVDTGGAGDQGIMYGYATVETPEYMPAPVVFAHELTRRLADLRRHDAAFSWLGPDGKSQVTMDHGRTKAVVLSTQHSPDIEQEQIRQMLVDQLITPVFGDLTGIDVMINPTGRFVTGGFAADTGLTGRKLMVDTYGGMIPHGGGAFSGKDSTKVDRSAAYMARFAAKNLVAGGYAKKCLVSVAYAIGKAEPVMLTARSEDGRDLSLLLKKYFDFRPRAIIERLGLRRPMFRETAAYGHFGRAHFPWEQIVKIR
jgi:S-adenosylmethionine synthetase